MSSSMADHGSTSANIMGKVWTKGSALITALGSKIVSVSPGKQKQDESRESDDDRRAARVRDSAKIQIRLLSKDENLDGIRRIAEESDEAELASFAVAFIVEGEKADKESHLIHLARSNSHACIPALISLFNGGSVEIAQEILLNRLASGEYFRLVQEKKVRAILLLDVLGAVDDFAKTNLCYENFPTIWHCLNERKDEQMLLLSEILGDLNPDGLRYLPDKNMIPQAVKMQTLHLLQALKPSNFERALWYASRDEDEEVAYAATMMSTEHWQSEGGCVPESLESFPMLNLNFLFYLCQQSSTFKWQGPLGINELYSQWNLDMDELETVDPVRELHRHTILKNKAEQTREYLIKITEKRLNTLQPLVDTITNSLRLPHASIRSTEVPGVAAAYLVGTGTVEFSKQVLLDDKPLTEEFMSSMLHELGHMEQDVLIIRMMADEIGLKYGQHGSHIRALFERYSDVIGYVPDSIFLLEVLRLRADVPLTAAELQRAQRLQESARHNVQSGASNKRIIERLAHLEESMAALEQGNYDWHLLDCLRDERSLTSLFDSGHVPGILIEEIRNCRQRIDELVNEALKDPARSIGEARESSKSNLQSNLQITASKILFLKKDNITLARELFSEKNSGDLEQVISHFRIVLCQILQEELKRLDKRVSELRREGYHEAEAYTISDRVEIIVNALRKGWYAFTS